MQEFSSISVSSYEAGTLAEQLTEQGRDGWSVVAIVPTGSTVTAYLSRDADGSVSSADEAAPDAAAATVAAVTANDAPSDDGAPETVDPVAEPAGWAAGAGAGAAAVAATTDDSAPTETSAPEPVAEVPPAESSPAEAASPAGGAAPAGWYADPSSRFELRYWDGGQWTEHVSRGGQQYTDPPVA